jgi:predicted phage tail protein
MTMRNVYLEGELANRFGDKVTVKASTMAEIFKVLNANDPTLRKYFIDCHEKGIGFSCETQNGAMDEEDCILPLEADDIYLSPIPAGSKSAGAKILTALAIAAMFIFAPAGGALHGFLYASGGGLTTGGMILAGIGVNLAMAGIQQMMMPDPATDKDTPESYLFNGNQRSIGEGDPVPLLYGELRVPGRPIGFEILNETTYYGSSSGGGPHGGLHNIGGSPGHVTQQLD